MKKSVCFLMAALFILLLPMNVPAEKRVFLEQETEAFGQTEALLTLRIAGATGGDCMLLSYGEENMLIDAGESFFFPHFEKMMAEAGAGKHVDALFNTHPHRDHINGFFEMPEHGYTVGKIYTVFPHDYTDGTPSVVQEKMIKTAEKYGIPVIDMANGDEFSFGPARITVIRLPEEKRMSSTSTNGLSALLMIRFGQCTMLLTGDIEASVQAILSGDLDLKTDVLKAPHHGLGGINRSFLKNADPEFVFFTNGSADTRTTWETLVKNNYRRYLFASWGEITISTNGEKWIVHQEPYPEIAEFQQRFVNDMLKK